METRLRERKKKKMKNPRSAENLLAYSTFDKMYKKTIMCYKQKEERKRNQPYRKRGLEKRDVISSEDYLVVK